jgi:23S rRNA pseudouridine1911/1915/1917 synthase
MREITLRVETGTTERIDRYLSEDKGIATRAQIQRLLRSGNVLVDGRRVKPSYRTRGGESVAVTIPDPEPARMVAQAIPLDVVYEDRYLLVVNKPAGMVVHPGSGVRRGTLANALLAHCPDLSGIGGVVRPGIVHRLDKGTSGLIVVAKDDATHLALSEALKARRVKRVYEAVVWGVPAAEGRVETLIGRSRRDRKKMAVSRTSGRSAVTSFRVTERFGFASRLEVRLETGRTHQIRVHLAHIGHPVFGDPTYGGRRRTYRDLSRDKMKEARTMLELIDRQALHAERLAFVHPHTGRRLEFRAPEPDDMRRLLSAMRRGHQAKGGEK